MEVQPDLAVEGPLSASFRMDRPQDDQYPLVQAQSLPELDQADVGRAPEAVSTKPVLQLFSVEQQERGHEEIPLIELDYALVECDVGYRVPKATLLIGYCHSHGHGFARVVACE